MHKTCNQYNEAEAGSKVGHAVVSVITKSTLKVVVVVVSGGGVGRGVGEV